MTEHLSQLLSKAFRCFRDAKGDHDILEQLYQPHMDFSRLEPVKQKILAEIRSL
jgi:hypothetical protein